MKYFNKADYSVSAEDLYFTDKHLQIHKKCFNREVRPEFFHFEIDGVCPIQYVGTFLVDDGVLKTAKNHISTKGGSQLFRKGLNNKFGDMADDVLENGVDLREKLTSVLLDLNVGESLPSNAKMKIEYIFSGNTIDLVMDKKTSLKNRIVHVFRKTKDYSLEKLISIGTKLNSLSKPESKQSIDSIEHALTTIVKEDITWKLNSDATSIEIEEYSQKLKNRAAYMLNVTTKNKVFKKNELKGVLASIVQNQLNETVLISVLKGKGSVDYCLELFKANNMISNQFVYYEMYGAFASKMFAHYSKLHRNFSVCASYDPDPQFNINDKNCTVNTVIHCGTPDICNSAYDFLKTVRDFLDEHDCMLNFMSNEYYTEKVHPNRRFNVIGFLQQVQALAHIWPMGSVIPIDEMRKLLKNNTIEDTIKSMTISTLSNFVTEEVTELKLEELV